MSTDERHNDYERRKEGDLRIDYQRPKDPKIFDMLVIVGLVFNVMVVIFIVLYWLDLL